MGSKKICVWPWLPISLIVAGAVANISTVVVAVSDPSFAVEEDYYAKATRWDELQQEQADSDALGRFFDVHSAHRDGSGTDWVIQLRERSGKLVVGARVVAEAYFVGLAAQRYQVELKETAAGNYAARVASNQPGIWQWRLVAQHGESRIIQTLRHELAKLR